MNFSRLLILCTGNICRSPVAEALLRERLPQDIESAGLGALVGHGVDPSAAVLAEQSGLDVSRHQARQVTQDMIHRADLILVMSGGQRRTVSQLAPAATGKTMLFGHWLSDRGGGGEDIPDPYRKSFEVFKYVHRQLVRAANIWQSKLG